MSTQWSQGHRLPFCALCCEYVVESTIPLPSQRTPGWPWAQVGGAA